MKSVFDSVILLFSCKDIFKTQNSAIACKPAPFCTQFSGCIILYALFTVHAQACSSNEDQDLESKKPKTDSIQPTEEDKLVAAPTKNQTEQSYIDEVDGNAEPSSADGTNYFDILVIGRTGLGKSSTVDKLLVPNRRTRSSTPHPSTNSRGTTSDTEEKDLQKIESDVDETGEIKYGNLRARILSVDKEDYETARKRLQNIAHCRGESNPHEEIDKLRSSDSQSVYGSTKHCELLTNTDSKIRILDVPGFFSPKLTGGATNIIDSNLATVRHIIHIQAAEKLEIKRILYFFPQSGPMTRPDRIMQEEIKAMVKFFGKSITKCMVLVCTIPEHLSKCTDLSSEQKFPQKSLSQSGIYFQEAFQRELSERQEDTATEELLELPIPPPTISVAMTDKCKEIFDRIKSVGISDNDYQLGFNAKTCCKCGIDRVQHEKNWVKNYLEDDLWCHPRIQPMYSANSMAKGVLKLLKFKWEFTKERCINCRKKLGSDNPRGCKKVNTVFKHRTKWWKLSRESVPVEHSNKVV